MCASSSSSVKIIAINHNRNITMILVDNVSFEGNALFTKELWSTRCWFDRRENWNKSENWSEFTVISFKVAMLPSNWWCEIFVLVTKYLNWRLNLWFGGGGGDAMESSNWSWNILISDVIFDLVIRACWREVKIPNQYGGVILWCLFMYRIDPWL